MVNKTINDFTKQELIDLIYYLYYEAPVPYDLFEGYCQNFIPNLKFSDIVYVLSEHEIITAISINESYIYINKKLIRDININFLETNENNLTYENIINIIETL